MKIKNLVERLDYTLLQGSLEEEITGFSHDNRHVEEGDLFICIKGARFDTHNCVADVAAKFVSYRTLSALAQERSRCGAPMDRPVAPGRIDDIRRESLDRRVGRCRNGRSRSALVA